MAKVVEFLDRAVERLEGYGSDARSLPALARSLYAASPDQPHTQPGYSRVQFRSLRHVPFESRKHRPHQMHAQFRHSCVKVLSILVKRMDVKTRQCVYVNPIKKTIRTLYVPEFARLTGLCDRTVTRVLGALVRARYLIRDAKNRFFLSAALFRDLSLSVTLDRLTNQLRGLGKAEARKPTEKPATSSPVRSQCDLDAKPAKRQPPSEASVAIGQSFLASLRRRRPPG